MNFLIAFFVGTALGCFVLNYQAWNSGDHIASKSLSLDSIALLLAAILCALLR